VVSPVSNHRFPTSTTSSGLAPLSPSATQFPVCPSATSPSENKPLRTRIAPNLEVAPRIVSVLRTPDISTGCTDPAKRRVVCSTRFSSRSGADRRLYASTYNIRDPGTAPPQSNVPSGGNAPTPAGTSTANGDTVNTPKLHNQPDDTDKTPSTAADLTSRTSAAPVSGSTEPADRDHSSSVKPIRGAWSAEREKLSQPTRNPMAMILDHESCVVGCQDGTVYRLSFVGDEYGDEPDHEPEPEPEPTVVAPKHEEDAGEESAGHVTISDLSELEHVWAELMLPDDAPDDHPGRWKVPPKQDSESAMERLGFK